jgi:hypothetical protein
MEVVVFMLEHPFLRARMSPVAKEGDQQGQACKRTRAQTEKLEVDDHILQIINNPIDRDTFHDPAHAMAISGCVSEV